VYGLDPRAMVHPVPDDFMSEPAARADAARRSPAAAAARWRSYQRDISSIASHAAEQETRRTAAPARRLRCPRISGMIRWAPGTPVVHGAPLVLDDNRLQA
jgi:hypothetical protein